MGMRLLYVLKSLLRASSNFASGAFEVEYTKSTVSYGYIHIDLIKNL